MGLKDGKTVESLGSVERTELHQRAEMEGGLLTCEWSLCVPLSVSFWTARNSSILTVLAIRRDVLKWEKGKSQ